MSELEQPSKPFPVNDNVIVKLPVGTDIVIVGNRVFKVANSPVYNSSKEFIDKVAKPIVDSCTPQLASPGIKLEILEPGKQWKTGKFRYRVVFEFIPDEPEITEASTKTLSESPLDEFRKTMNGM